jgi:hypothetical protein
MVAVVCGGGKLFTSWLVGSKEPQEGTKDKIPQGQAPSELLPPAKSNFLKFPEHPKIAYHLGT